jgi:hypothetical protein
MSALEILIQGIITLLTFALGVLSAFAQQYYQKYRDSLKEKYFGLYRPFMQMNSFHYMVDVAPYSEWEHEDQVKIVKFLADKDYLASEALQGSILNFIKITTCMNYPNEADNTEVAPMKDNAFSTLYDEMKSEYLTLSKKLNYKVTPWLEESKGT